MDLRYEWSSDNLTPELQQAVGRVVLHWSRLEFTLWILCHAAMTPGKSVPGQVADQLKILKTQCGLQLASHPDFIAAFEVFCAGIEQDLLLRNALAHGMPATISRAGREAFGVVVPPHGKRAGFDYPEFSIPVIDALTSRIIQAQVRLSEWGGEINYARLAADPTLRQMAEASGRPFVQRVPDAKLLT